MCKQYLNNINVPIYYELYEWLSDDEVPHPPTLLAFVFSFTTTDGGGGGCGGTWGPPKPISSIKTTNIVCRVVSGVGGERWSPDTADAIASPLHPERLHHQQVAHVGTESGDDANHENHHHLKAYK
jgi:hypothetical protein